MADRPNDPWAELGIPATADPAAIRRAYAARLKLIRPDGDLQRFVALRAAYEQALAQSSSDTTGSRTRVAPPRVRPAELDRAGRSEAQSQAEPARPGRVADLLSRGDVIGAALWLVSGQSAGSTSLDQGLQAADRLGWAMAQDLDLDATAVREAAIRLGWPANAGNAAWAEVLQTRLDADDWLAALRQTAGTDAGGVRSREKKAAHFLLGRGPSSGLWEYQYDDSVRRYYGEYLLHAPIVGEAFDPVRIAQISALITRAESTTASLLLTVLGFVAFAGLAGYLIGLASPVLGMMTTGGLIVGPIIWGFTHNRSQSACAQPSRSKR